MNMYDSAMGEVSGTLAGALLKYGGLVYGLETSLRKTPVEHSERLNEVAES